MDGHSSFHSIKWPARRFSFFFLHITTKICRLTYIYLMPNKTIGALKIIIQYCQHNMSNNKTWLVVFPNEYIKQKWNSTGHSAICHFRHSRRQRTTLHKALHSFDFAITTSWAITIPFIGNDHENMILAPTPNTYIETTANYGGNINLTAPQIKEKKEKNKYK